MATRAAAATRTQVKPENICIGADGYATLVDLGFSRSLPPEGRAHTLLGTPHYLAPEVFLARGHAKPSDLWALGATLYLLLMAAYAPHAPGHRLARQRRPELKMCFESHRHAEISKLFSFVNLQNPRVRPSYNAYSRIGELSYWASELKENARLKVLDEAMRTKLSADHPSITAESKLCEVLRRRCAALAFTAKVIKVLPKGGFRKEDRKAFAARAMSDDAPSIWEQATLWVDNDEIKSGELEKLRAQPATAS